MLARINHIGWVHLWVSREAFEAGEASDHYFNPRTDPRWVETFGGGPEEARLLAGEMLELEDPGYFED